MLQLVTDSQLFVKSILKCPVYGICCSPVIQEVNFTWVHSIWLVNWMRQPSKPSSFVEKHMKTVVDRLCPVLMKRRFDWITVVFIQLSSFCFYENFCRLSSPGDFPLGSRILLWFLFSSLDAYIFQTPRSTAQKWRSAQHAHPMVSAPGGLQASVTTHSMPRA